MLFAIDRSVVGGDAPVTDVSTSLGAGPVAGARPVADVPVVADLFAVDVLRMLAGGLARRSVASFLASWWGPALLVASLAEAVPQL